MTRFLSRVARLVYGMGAICVESRAVRHAAFGLPLNFEHVVEFLVFSERRFAKHAKPGKSGLPSNMQRRRQVAGKVRSNSHV